MQLGKLSEVVRTVACRVTTCAFQLHCIMIAIGEWHGPCVGSLLSRSLGSVPPAHDQGRSACQSLVRAGRHVSRTAISVKIVQIRYKFFPLQVVQVPLLAGSHAPWAPTRLYNAPIYRMRAS
jgi:hypothetical protein